MPPPPYRQYRIERPDGRAAYVEHNDGRRVLVGFSIPGIHHLSPDAAQRWIDDVVGAAGSWLTAEQLLGR